MHKRILNKDELLILKFGYKLGIAAGLGISIGITTIAAIWREGKIRK